MSKKTKEKSQTNVPNIQYVGKRQKFDKTKLKMVQAAKQVPEFIMDGKTKIKLPEGIEQGVFMPPDTVARLFAARPNDFKTPVPKAAKQTAKPKAQTPDLTPDKPKSENTVEVNN
jgi:hypothetical protein